MVMMTEVVLVFSVALVLAVAVPTGAVATAAEVQ